MINNKKRQNYCPLLSRPRDSWPDCRFLSFSHDYLPVSMCLYLGTNTRHHNEAEEEEGGRGRRRKGS